MLKFFNWWILSNDFVFHIAFQACVMEPVTFNHNFNLLQWPGKTTGRWWWWWWWLKVTTCEQTDSLMVSKDLGSALPFNSVRGVDVWIYYHVSSCVLPGMSFWDFWRWARTLSHPETKGLKTQVKEWRKEGKRRCGSIGGQAWLRPWPSRYYLQFITTSNYYRNLFRN